jgi:hypothetical protein
MDFHCPIDPVHFSSLFLQSRNLMGLHDKEATRVRSIRIELYNLRLYLQNFLLRRQKLARNEEGNVDE